MWQLYECKLIRWIRKQYIIYLSILYSGELGELPEKIGPSQYAFVQSLAAVHLKSFETIELLPGQI